MTGVSQEDQAAWLAREEECAKSRQLIERLPVGGRNWCFRVRVDDGMAAITIVEAVWKRTPAGLVRQTTLGVRQCEPRRLRLADFLDAGWRTTKEMAIAVALDRARENRATLVHEIEQVDRLIAALVGRKGD